MKIANALAMNMCRAKYTGKYVSPARLTDKEINEILGLFSSLPTKSGTVPREEMRELLKTNRNNPTLLSSGTADTVSRILERHPLNGKCYRIGRERGFCQLWEVQPPER